LLFVVLLPDGIIVEQITTRRLLIVAQCYHAVAYNGAAFPPSVRNLGSKKIKPSDLSRFMSGISFADRPPANPAVTLARAFTDTFAGIRPLDAPGFIVTQLLGAFAATVLFRWLVPTLPSEAKEIVFPRTDTGP
jgi:hypothetical protein